MLIVLAIHLRNDVTEKQISKTNISPYRRCVFIDSSIENHESVLVSLSEKDQNSLRGLNIDLSGLSLFFYSQLSTLNLIIIL